MKAWKVLADHVYEQFKIFRIRKSTRQNPRTEKTFDFFLMDGMDWTNIIALTADNKVVLVKQYRHGCDAVTTEIPGGCIEPGEDPQLATLRELKEETGYTADSVELLGVIHPNPAMQAMRCYCFFAKNAVKVTEQKLDHGEDIEYLELPLPRVLKMITDGTITHAIVLSAFAHLLIKHPELAV